MDKFLEMKVFAAIVEAGSFTAAASILNLPKGSVSRHLSELEQRLGTRLMQRTTRKLSTTSEGDVFYVRCRDLLRNLDEAEAEITARNDEAIGLLRVTVPVTFGLMHLAPLWPVLLDRHPKLDLEITLSDRPVDLIDEGFDVAIRIGNLPSSSLIRRKLATTRMILCASPAYLGARGEPTLPSDLLNHDVIAHGLYPGGETWNFTGPEGPTSVKIMPRMRTNSGDTCRAAALQDRGAVLQPCFMVGQDLLQGSLKEIMPNFRTTEMDIFAIYSSRKFVSPKIRVLIDFLVEEFAMPRWGR